jgi:hypothetical protein
MSPVATTSETHRLKDAIDRLISLLDPFLNPFRPPPGGLLPDPLLLVVSVAERSVGIGDFRGTQTVGSFGTVELKGVRVDAVVRFLLWASDPVQAEKEGKDLHEGLLGSRDALRSKGFLRLALEDAPPAEALPGLWRKAADYRFLFEFGYEDTGGAESLIARIPIDSDLEERDSLDRETTEVSDELVRWDNLGAPPLVVRGRTRVGRVSSLAFRFQPGSVPAGTVSLLRTFDGATGAPVVFTSLAAFLDAVSGPNPAERQVRATFPSVEEFLAELGPPDNRIVELGDWNDDHTLDSYESRSFAIEPPVELAGVPDRLEITFGQAAFDQLAVVYLRATRG